MFLQSGGNWISHGDKRRAGFLRGASCDNWNSGTVYELFLDGECFRSDNRSRFLFGVSISRPFISIFEFNVRLFLVVIRKGNFNKCFFWYPNLLPCIYTNQYLLNIVYIYICMSNLIPKLIILCRSKLTKLYTLIYIIHANIYTHIETPHKATLISLIFIWAVRYIYVYKLRNIRAETRYRTELGIVNTQ